MRASARQQLNLATAAESRRLAGLLHDIDALPEAERRGSEPSLACTAVLESIAARHHLTAGDLALGGDRRKIRRHGADESVHVCRRDALPPIRRAGFVWVTL